MTTVPPCRSQPGAVRRRASLPHCAMVAALLILAPAAHAAEPGSPDALELAWLTELGAEGIEATPSPMDVRDPVWVNVPGAALSFRVNPDGSLARLGRLATDYSSAQVLATSARGTVVADREGSISLWGPSSSSPAHELRWRRPLGQRAMSVAWNGGPQIWVATRDGELFALHSRDGEPLWRVTIEGRAEAPAVGTDTDVYVATKSGVLYRIDAATGTIRWKTELSGPVIHPPVLPEGESRTVLCGTWAGELSAFEASSGNPLWSVDLSAKLAAAPTAGAGRVAAVTVDGTAHVFDLAGRSQWQASQVADGPADVSISDPSLGPPRLLVVSKRPTWLDLATGELRNVYPEDAAQDLRRRFAEAMMEGEKTYSEAEKSAALDREAFPISGPLFGPVRRVGRALAFGTEDGWIYLFDAATLRPTFRYRAGFPVAGMPSLYEDRLLAAAGEEVFALAPDTGRVLWRRGVGGTVKEVEPGATLAVLTNERLTTLDARDGSRGWTQRVRARFVSGATAPGDDPTSDLWLVDDGGGKLQAIDRTGRVVTERATDGTLLVAVTLPEPHTWAAATREGRLFGVAWRAGSAGADGGVGVAARLERTWEHTLEAPIADLRLAGPRLLVRLENGALLSVEPLSGRELWRMSLTGTERYDVVDGQQAMVVFGGDTVRVYDLWTGGIRFAREARSEAVGVELRGARLRWLDRAGRVHTADISDGRILASRDLGVSLEAARPGAGGFWIKTSAGEIGFAVERGRGEAAAAPDQGQADQTGGGR